MTDTSIGNYQTPHLEPLWSINTFVVREIGYVLRSNREYALFFSGRFAAKTVWTLSADDARTHEFNIEVTAVKWTRNRIMKMDKVKNDGCRMFFTVFLVVVGGFGCGGNPESYETGIIAIDGSLSLIHI